MRRHSRWVLLFVPLLLSTSSRAGGPTADEEPIYQGKTLAEWIDDLQDPKGERQRAAVQSLAVFGPKREVVSALRSALKNGEVAVVLRAAQTLGKFGLKAKEALPELRETCKKLRAGPSPLPSGENYAEEYLQMFAETRRAVAEAMILIDDHPGPEIAPLLLEVLNTDDADKRREIVIKLGKLGPAAAKTTVPALIAVLEDTERAARTEAWRYPDASYSTKKSLTRENLLAIRLEAIKSLGRIGPAAKPALHALTLAMKFAAPAKNAAMVTAEVSDKPVGSADAKIRTISFTVATGDKAMLRACAEALGRIRPDAKGTVGALRFALRDLDEDVRWAALSALLEHGQDTQEFVPIFFKFLHDKDGALRRVAVKVLGKSGAERKQVLPALTAALKDKDLFVRVTAAEALGELKPKAKQAVPALLAALKDTEKGVRAAAAESLRKIGVADKDVIQALIAVLGDKETEVFLAASKTLGKFGPQAKAAIPRMIVLLQDSDVDKRAMTCLVLGSIGPAAKEAIAPLEKISQDDSKEMVRLVAHAALAKIDSSRLKDTLPRLTAALTQSDNGELAEMAAMSLILLGPDARDVLPKLRKFRDQPSNAALRSGIDRLIEGIQHGKSAFDW